MRGFKRLSTASTPLLYHPQHRHNSRQNGQRLRPPVPNDQVGQHSCPVDLPALSVRSSLDDLGVHLLQASPMPTLHAVCLTACVYMRKSLGAETVFGSHMRKWVCKLLCCAFTFFFFFFFCCYSFCFCNLTRHQLRWPDLQTVRGSTPSRKWKASPSWSRCRCTFAIREDGLSMGI